MTEILVEGLTATVIGMGMVFGVLTILCVILSFFKYLTPQEAPKAAVEPSESDEAVMDTDGQEEIYDDTELIAAISGALAAYMGEGAPAVSIKSIKPATGTYRAWNVAAIRENHRGLY